MRETLYAFWLFIYTTTALVVWKHKPLENMFKVHIFENDTIIVSM